MEPEAEVDPEEPTLDEKIERLEKAIAESKTARAKVKRLRGVNGYRRVLYFDEQISIKEAKLNDLMRKKEG